MINLYLLNLVGRNYLLPETARTKAQSPRMIVVHS